MDELILSILRLYSYSYDQVYDIAISDYAKTMTNKVVNNNLLKIIYDPISTGRFHFFNSLKLQASKTIPGAIKIKNGLWNGIFYKQDYGKTWFIINHDVYDEIFGIRYFSYETC